MSISGSTLDAQYMAAHGAMYPKVYKGWPVLEAVHFDVYAFWIDAYT